MKRTDVRERAVSEVRRRAVHATQPSAAPSAAPSARPRFQLATAYDDTVLGGQVRSALRAFLRLGLVTLVPNGSTPLFHHFRVELTPLGTDTFADW